MRYVYIKAGYDAVDQVRRLASTQDRYRSGPDAYIGEFLEHRSRDDVLVLCRTGISEQFEFGRVVARSYRNDTRLRRLISTLQVGSQYRYVGSSCAAHQSSVDLGSSCKATMVPIVNSRHGGLRPAGRIHHVGLGSHVHTRVRCRRCNGHTADQMCELKIRPEDISVQEWTLFVRSIEKLPPPGS
jgi:hypothetical protein